MCLTKMLWYLALCHLSAVSLLYHIDLYYIFTGMVTHVTVSVSIWGSLETAPRP